jgi:hypothetical protein
MEAVNLEVCITSGCTFASAHADKQHSALRVYTDLLVHVKFILATKHAYAAGESILFCKREYTRAENMRYMEPSKKIS